MPSDSQPLRNILAACLPSFVIDGVAKESGQRVVYYGHFDDSLIPSDIDPDGEFLNGWQAWGNVVAKVAHGTDATSLSRLQRETVLLGELNSPYFPRLFFAETFVENPLTEEPLLERLYVTIEEHVHSAPLSACMDKYSSEASVVDLLRQLATGLSSLWEHSRRLVHRDLKPDNILIRPDGTVVVIDLGIARETGSAGLTHTAHAFGPMSPAYAAPEQVNNDKYAISFKTDFFALGIIAYQCLAGRNPFMKSANCSAHEAMEMVVTHTPPTLSSLGRASEGLSKIVEKMMAKEPYQRHRTTAQLIDELTALGETQ
jgi:serine/threonine protein kinase